MEMKLCLFFCLIAAVDANFFYVTAPNVIRFNNPETILVGIFGNTKRDVTVWLQIEGKGKKFSEKRISVEKEDTPVTETVKVGEDDLFDKDDKDEEKPKYVILHATASGLGTHSTKILLSYHTGYILLQTSKPLYHPNEKVNVRALAMTESLKFAKNWNITMDLISPSDLTYDRVNKGEPNAGKFYKESFKLPPHPEFGMWTIKAYYKGQYKTQARATFMVQEYVLPTFDVNIAVSEKVILPETKSVNITVTAMYVYGKPVQGTAILNISTIAEGDTVKSYPELVYEKLDSDGKSVFSFDDIKQIIDFNSDGLRLLVVATVVEKATGDTENASSQQTVISNKKYHFSFEKSKKYYHPGFSYNLKVVISLANGDIPEETITVKAKSSTGEEDEIKINKGFASFFFNTNDRKGTITFTVKVGDESGAFTIEDYDGPSHIQVSQKIDDGKMTIATLTTGKDKSGALLLFLSRGKYIDRFYLGVATESNKVISDVTQEMLSPEARVVGIYVDKTTGKLVADSDKFSFENPKCPGKGLQLNTLANVKPDDVKQLTVTGTPGMSVGLNVMDTALLLLNSTNVLRKNKMFDMMKSHDLGCGEGGGKTAGQVLRDAGLTIVTNAQIDENNLMRESMSCDKHSRKKRATYCYETNQQDCCEKGKDYALELLYDPDVQIEDLNIETACHAAALKLAKLRDEANNYKYSRSCLAHFYRKCTEYLLEEQYGNEDIVAKSALDDSNEYLQALKKIDMDANSLQARKNFKDSWFFNEVELDEKGERKTSLTYPSSITTWMIQAVGLTENKGFCIADPTEVIATKNLFTQLKLPYKATRLEYIEISATIFWYGELKDGSKPELKVYVEGTHGICTGVPHGKTRLIASFKVVRNDAFNVRIPIYPLKAGKFPIRVKSVLAAETDIIEKELLVVNEGIEEREAITVCLDPVNEEENTKCASSERVIDKRIDNGEQTSVVNLTLPDNAIKDTGSAYGYAVSNIMDDVVQTIISGIDNMLRQPMGCGEQTMIFLGPSVYVMAYWKQTNQMNEQREKNGNTWIRQGVTRELTFKKPDGSYGAWLHRTSSTWLTAFVAKVFCQAHKVVDNAVDREKHVLETIKWLQGKTRADGSFYDPLPVIHREMIGQIKEQDPSLTAFVLISLLECDLNTEDLERTKRKAVQYLESQDDALYKNNPYLLAITTYALAMAKSPERYHFKDMLIEKQKKNEAKNFLYWGDGTASANSIETTAYALLALLKFDKIRTAGKIVRWLTFHRSASGSFKTTQDTIIGLQALSEYNILTYSSDVDLNIRLIMKGMDTKSHTLTTENSDLLKIIKDIPVKDGKERKLFVEVRGKGSGRLVIDYRYNRKKTDVDKCDFRINDGTSEIEIFTVNKPDKVLGMKDLPNFGRNCDNCGCEGDDKNGDIIINDEEDHIEVQAHNARKKRNADAGSDGKLHCIRFNISSIDNRVHGMSVVDVGLETGVTVVEKDLVALKEKGVIDNYEMPSDGKGFFIMYLDGITSEPKKVSFKLEDELGDNTGARQTVAIKVYDYYKPEYECRKFYGTGDNSAPPIQFQCEDDDGKKTGMCTCLDNVCPKPNEGEFRIAEYRNKEKPAKKLRDYTCNPDKANLAMAVKITKVTVSLQEKSVTMQAVVLENIHQGTAPLKEEDEIELFMGIHCANSGLKLKEGNMYYIISKDGEKTDTDDGGTLYRFQLTASTVIIEKRDKKEKLKGNAKLLHQIMNAYVNLMLKGCQN